MHTETKIFLTHFLHLTFLRGISRVLPLVSSPFLIHTIGIEQFGILEFSKAISFYFTTFVNYGFSYSATKQISLHKQDNHTIGQIISSVYAIKIIILLACFLVLITLIYFVPKLQQEKLYLLSFFPVVVASSLFPTFAFQGLHRIHWLTLLNLITKVLFLVSLFVFIHRPSDALIFPILLAVADAIRLGIAFFILHNRLAIPLKKPVWSIIKEQIQEGIHIFLSQLTAMFYARFSILFLGFWGNSTMVAIYNIGEKIVRMTEVLLEAFMQALYPLSYAKITQNLPEGIRYIIKYAKVGIICLFLLGITYLVGAQGYINLLTGGKSLPKAVSILRIHAFLPIILFLSNLLGVGILVPLKEGKKYTLTIALAGLVAASLHTILVPTFKTDGAAWAVLCSEIMVVSLLAIITYRTISKKIMDTSI
jgi:PST family polysaccharide transporter